MRAYAAYILITLRLTMRDRLVVFFNYLFPLIFFISFAEGFSGSSSRGAMNQVFTMVLVLGVLGSGFFGGGLRAVMEREQGILRRFKVAPISPGPILVSSIVTGWILFLPAVFLFLAIGMLRYNMAWPGNFITLLVMVTLGCVAFRSVGLIIASVVNTMQESQIIVQLLYLPMLMLSGATIPLSTMPDWLQVVAQFLPATHFYLGMQGILMRGESLADNWTAVLALTVSTLVCLFVCFKLFRWEKEEKVKAGAKGWVAAALLPFVLLGGWQAFDRSNLRKTREISAGMRRSVTWLIRQARIVSGDGRVIERGAVLIRDGKIQRVYEGSSPEADSLKAEDLEASGKTVLPGLIDAAAFLGYRDERAMDRALAAYLYCGVTHVMSPSANPQLLPAVRRRVLNGELLAAEPLAGSPSTNNPAARAVEEYRLDPSILDGRSLTQQVMPPSPDALLAQLKLPPAGPAIHRSLQLMVQRGMSPADAIREVTSASAQRAAHDACFGVVREGCEASLIVVEGNPLQDISATERISAVFFKGERVVRSELFSDFDKKKR
jgi:ABC-type multidrug transport system permease subunit